jgi:hypothetical protein
MSETEREPYQLSECTVRIVITLLPRKDDNSERECLIAASTHDDFPVGQCIKFSELKPLPKPIKEILKQLLAELPERKFKAEVKEFNAQKSTNSQTSTNNTEKKQETTKSNQTKLFDT